MKTKNQKINKTAKTITATAMQAKSGQILRQVYSGEHFIVERNGYPIAVIVPLSWYRAVLSLKLVNSKNEQSDQIT